ASLTIEFPRGNAPPRPPRPRGAAKRDAPSPPLHWTASTPVSTWKPRLHCATGAGRGLAAPVPHRRHFRLFNQRPQAVSTWKLLGPPAGAQGPRGSPLRKPDPSPGWRRPRFPRGNRQAAKPCLPATAGSRRDGGGRLITLSSGRWPVSTWKLLA